MNLVIKLEKNPLFKKDSVWNVKWFSLNKSLHWSEKRKIKSEWQDWVAGQFKYGNPTYIHPTIQITIFFPDKRRRDPDNFEPIKKPIMDGLVQAGVIKDDSSKDYNWKRLEMEYDKDNPRVEIEVEELE